MSRFEPLRRRHVISALACVAGAGLVLAGLAVGLTGCAHPPTIGTVTSKKFSPSYTWTELVCIQYGKYGCSMWMPFNHTEPDAYTLCLRRDAQDTEHDETGCWDTDPTTYARYRVGAHYPDGAS